MATKTNTNMADNNADIDNAAAVLTIGLVALLADEKRVYVTG